jgi:sigma-B regulation protein RsbU (phosphoserine phosphatase)
MTTADLRRDPKQLYRRLDGLFGSLDRKAGRRRLLETFLDELMRSLREDLSLVSGALYSERRQSFAQLRRVGGEGAAFRREAPPTLRALELLLKHRTYIYPDPADEGAPSRAGLLPPGPAAAFLVGEPPARAAFFFQLGGGWSHDELDFALNTIRSTLDSRLIEQRIRGTVREAAQIQRSLLLERPPELPGYDVACRTTAAEEVGGDFYDFLLFDGDALGLSIGDASGHGLPAALLVRDVVTGLRMGLERDLKMVPVVSKLNRVIHRSNLTSRFVSLFYGELEANGNLTYVNAGHQPPLLFLEGRVLELAVGGTVIGPMPEASFKRGFAHVDRGGTLVLCTDGLVERANATGEQFGVERLKAAVLEGPRASAPELVERLFSAAFDFGGRAPWEDDATAVVVVRKPRSG